MKFFLKNCKRNSPVINSLYAADALDSKLGYFYQKYKNQKFCIEKIVGCGTQLQMLPTILNPNIIVFEFVSLNSCT